MLLQEVRKEDEIYFVGPFWIISKSEYDINKGNFRLVGEKIPVDYEGNYLNGTSSRKGTTSHKKLWAEYALKYDNVPYNYFPRGRVRIVDGGIFIHLNSKTNTPRVINSIIEMYGLEKLTDINIEEDDLQQGDHYNFLLPKRA